MYLICPLSCFVHSMRIFYSSTHVFSLCSTMLLSRICHLDKNTKCCIPIVFLLFPFFYSLTILCIHFSLHFILSLTCLLFLFAHCFSSDLFFLPFFQLIVSILSPSFGCLSSFYLFFLLTVFLLSTFSLYSLSFFFLLLLSTHCLLFSFFVLLIVFFFFLFLLHVLLLPLNSN